ncbi:hypothetical protein H4219_001708 [Mycoemilia scoparia]|uniref:NAD(P)-binding protein n=1 Tax=Mycoemilia scoparia TaxID=417184 RepID=A0A9W8A4A7_9FUNG|nr:hypothetical protein H4219_001708 [Mycoemilia scoparia]
MSSRKVVVVTGSSEGGIGAGLCRQFHEEGYIVYATGRSAEKLAPLAEIGIRTRVMDVNDEESVKATIDDIVDEAGIDILVNNAGVHYVTPVSEVNIEQAMAQFNTNVFGIARTVKACVPHMAKRKSGMIINVGSPAGYAATPWSAAAHKLSDSLRIELAPFNIKVVVVAPGAVKSHIVDNHRPLEIKEDSLFAPAAESIMARMVWSQGPQSISSKQFATAVVKKVTDGTIPNYFTYGPFAGQLWWCYYLPTWITDWLFTRKFNINKLKKA